MPKLPGINHQHTVRALEKTGFCMIRQVKYIYWQDEDKWLGYLEEFPDYMTQGETLDDLKEHLLDLYADLTGGEIPCVRRMAELEVS